jgi:hypothetical protein
VPNRVLRDGAFKAPPLRNVEMTGPYFHTGSYLTLRQVVDFYFRGGDFPVVNADSRDPQIVDLDLQATAFGRTGPVGGDLDTPVNFVFSTDPPYTLTGTFVDGLPDTVFRYDEYPDSDHPFTPEPVFASRQTALEDAKNAIVKFLLALTDPRVKYERAPFDRPEIFVPIDGAAPDNTTGRAALLADARFRHIPAVGAAGNATPLPNFLGVSSIQGSPGPDHFDPAVPFADGCLNCGGVVTVTDALRALQIAVGTIVPTPEDFLHLDVAPLVGGIPAPDGIIDIADALVILQKAVGLINF